MTIDPENAALSLDDVKRIQQRTRAAIYYGGSSAALIMWGLLTSFGYLYEYFINYRCQLVWMVILFSGLAGGFGLAVRRRRYRSERPGDWRLLYAQLVLVAFGFLLTSLYSAPLPRQLGAFWPSLFMLGFMLAGFWLGRFFLICGLTVTLLIAAIYLWSGPWFPLGMAIVQGPAFILSGLWLRKIGV